MIQLETCYQTLELFTNRKGIASAGYRLAFKIITENKKRYRPLFDTDPSLGVKIGRFLDNVFQNFCSDLSEQIFDDDPIKSARRRLEYRFEDQVRSFFNGIRNGVVPSILLPASLTPTSSVTGATEDSGRGDTKKADSKKTKSKGNPVVNPEIKAEWRIPPGKRFGDFFSPSRPEMKENCEGWPVFSHQTLKIGRQMCLRFQTTGECGANCPHAHTLPSAMPPRMWDEVRVRLTKILGA
jgi:hypothetical protein